MMFVPEALRWKVCFKPTQLQYPQYAQLNASYKNKVKASVYLKASPNFFPRPRSKKSTVAVHKSLSFPVLNITEAAAETLVLWFPCLFYQQPSEQHQGSICVRCSSSLLPSTSSLTFTPPALPCFHARYQKQQEELRFSPSHSSAVPEEAGITLLASTSPFSSRELCVQTLEPASSR